MAYLSIYLLENLIVLITIKFCHESRLLVTEILVFDCIFWGKENKKSVVLLWSEEFFSYLNFFLSFSFICVKVDSPNIIKYFDKDM